MPGLSHLDTEGSERKMPHRNSLHNLVDTLPEEALESIERVLQHHQKWPPQPPIDVQKLRDQVRERFAKMRKNTPEKPGGESSVVSVERDMFRRKATRQPL